MVAKKNLGKNLGKSIIPQIATFCRYWDIEGGHLDDEERYLEFIQDLDTAHTHAQRALNALYSPSGPKRSILYRIALGRAQSLLIGLYTQELQRRHQRGIDQRPAKPPVADGDKSG